MRPRDFFAVGRRIPMKIVSVELSHHSVAIVRCRNHLVMSLASTSEDYTMSLTG